MTTLVKRLQALLAFVLRSYRGLYRGTRGAVDRAQAVVTRAAPPTTTTPPTTPTMLGRARTALTDAQAQQRRLRRRFRRLGRIFRAAGLALWMTARGQRPRTWRDERPQLAVWIVQARTMALAAQAALEEHTTEAARAAAGLSMDGRAVSPATLLAGVVYHLRTEMPHMMDQGGPHALTAVYAANLNDRYAAQLLSRADALPAAFRGVAAQLADVLADIPSSQPENVQKA